MNTFLGAAQMLEPRHGRPDARRRSEDRLPRRLFVGPGGAARGDGGGDRRGPRRRDARSPSPCPTASASTATATASGKLLDDGGSTSCSPTRPRSCSDGRRPMISRRRSTASPPRSPTLVVTRSEAWRDRRVAATSAPRSPPSRSSGWSTPPAPATCSPRASSPARRAGLGLENIAEARRDRRRRSDPALWRAARSGPQGAGRRSCSHKKRAAPQDRPLLFQLRGLGPDDRLAARRPAARPRGIGPARRRRSPDGPWRAPNCACRRRSRARSPRRHTSRRRPAPAISTVKISAKQLTIPSAGRTG